MNFFTVALLCMPCHRTPAKRQKYVAKDLATKVKILQVLKNGASQQDIMKRYNVERSSL